MSVSCHSNFMNHTHWKAVKTRWHKKKWWTFHGMRLDALHDDMIHSPFHLLNKRLRFGYTEYLPAHKTPENFGLFDTCKLLSGFPNGKYRARKPKKMTGLSRKNESGFSEETRRMSNDKSALETWRWFQCTLATSTEKGKQRKRCVPQDQERERKKTHDQDFYLAAVTFASLDWN